MFISAPKLRGFFAATLAVAALCSGCGAMGGVVYGYDQMGNPITDPAVAQAMGLNVGAGAGAYGNTYGSDYGSSYGNSYGNSYGAGTGSDYSSSYGSDYSYGSGSDYSSDYGTTASPTPVPAAVDPGLANEAVLSAYVKEVKELGLFGLGKIVAKVEITNPSARTRSGLLRVRFLDGGNPTANAQTKRVTLQPGEIQVLTFTASAWRLDDAEAIMENDPMPTTASSSVVVDRTPTPSPSPSFAPY